MFGEGKSVIALGGHGFPEGVTAVEVLIEILRQLGNSLKSFQGQVANGYKKPLQSKVETTVTPNLRDTLSIPLEKEAYQIIKESLLRFTPSEVSFLAEEEEHAISQRAYWVVDPICNIHDYINGGKDWSISIGFAADGQPTGGVVFYPARGEFLFTCEDGQSHRRIVGNDFKHETALVSFSSERTDLPSTLSCAFAKSTHRIYPQHNADVLTNVALKAIVARVENRPHVNPELPLELTRQ